MAIGMSNLKDFIRTVPDFPIPGIQFRDITSLIEDPAGLNNAIVGLLHEASKFRTTVIVGVESRGFVFGSPVAWDLGTPFVMARKPGKLPNETFKKQFDLEYGSTSLEIQTNTEISSSDKVVIIDDLIATGGTAVACADLIHEHWHVPKENILVLAVIDLPDLNGSKLLKKNGYSVSTLVEFEGG